MKLFAITVTALEILPGPSYAFLIGAWLVLEKWMDAKPFWGPKTQDKYSLSQELGENVAKTRLEEHWRSFFSEKDVEELKAAECASDPNRILGFWELRRENPYVTGAEAYLDKAIDWARKNVMKVWVDLHGVPGSQNGFDNPGQSGVVDWQKGDNIQKIFEILKVMAKKNGAQEYAYVVHAIELISEPVTMDTYWKVKELTANKNMQIIMNDAFTPFDLMG
ncbi:glycoside hydrolase superfamily [Tirmania nivea]|nr:glycoside hydrolase superfamily [Tirmania nivea]